MTRQFLDLPARNLSQAIADLGLAADPQALVERVRQLQRDLPAEDEFTLLLSWLGKCSIVHQLDQLQLPPSSKRTCRVPDLFAVFRFKGREVPTFIEVKSSVRNTLSWRPDYYKALRAYANRLDVPLLVAWRSTKLGLWTLCDSSLFELGPTNYRLTHEKALRNNLMCELAGDFMYVFRPGVGLHIRFKKLKELPTSKPDTQSLHLRITNAHFTDSEGNHLKTLGPGIWWMFLAIDPVTETDMHPRHIDQRFLTIEESPMQAAHRLLGLVTMGLREQQAVPWRKLMNQHRFAIDGRALAEAARSSIPRNIVRYVLHQQPVQIPDFLK